MTVGVLELSQLLNKYLLSGYSVPSDLLGTGATSGKRRPAFPEWAFSAERSQTMEPTASRRRGISNVQLSLPGSSGHP